MFGRDDPSSPSSQPHLDAVSRERPPQFNWKNCGYDCGEGCEKVTEDEGDGGSDDETAVDLEEVRTSAATSHSGDTRNEDHPGTSSHEDQSLRVAHWEGSSSPLDDSSGSLQVGLYTHTDRSPELSPGSSARTRSPDPGMSYWTAGLTLPVASELPFRYFFLQTPLRLSPQYEHCRGEPASHLVVRDRTSLSFLMEQTWRGYTPAYGYISPPRVDTW
ncbi:hypothetical protein BDW02DRAFT_130507 [Decorospora gaudefroyi]|uniref:Uncharacterized protein n=1 Tax=Decorospora gaudefroyi TaxID=184978 RepID=A0A6A5KR12_9PLEO|nr:hypothetical protein BDW02DRAFT_130507 [Decorospora gaudefroyi]